jgi:hypothetical protein
MRILPNYPFMKKIELLFLSLFFAIQPSLVIFIEYVCRLVTFLLKQLFFPVFQIITPRILVHGEDQESDGPTHHSTSILSFTYDRLSFLPPILSLKKRNLKIAHAKSLIPQAEGIRYFIDCSHYLERN